MLFETLHFLMYNGVWVVRDHVSLARATHRFRLETQESSFRTVLRECVRSVGRVVIQTILSVGHNSHGRCAVCTSQSKTLECVRVNKHALYKRRTLAQGAPTCGEARKPWGIKLRVAVSGTTHEVDGVHGGTSHSFMRNLGFIATLIGRTISLSPTCPPPRVPCCTRVLLPC